MPKSFLNRQDLPVGLRNNNPGNIVRTNITWGGEIPHSQSTSTKFEQYTELRWGIRAMMRNIITKINKGNNTINGIITSWAPASDNNDTNSYINTVVSVLGLNRLAVIEPTEEVVVALAKIITRVENGSKASLVTDSDYRDALAILGITLKKKAQATP